MRCLNTGTEQPMCLKTWGCWAKDTFPLACLNLRTHDGERRPIFQNPSRFCSRVSGGTLLCHRTDNQETLCLIYLPQLTQYKPHLHSVEMMEPGNDCAVSSISFRCCLFATFSTFRGEEAGACTEGLGTLVPSEEGEFNS